MNLPYNLPCTYGYTRKHEEFFCHLITMKEDRFVVILKLEVAEKRDRKLFLSFSFLTALAVLSRPVLETVMKVAFPREAFNLLLLVLGQL